MRKRSASADHLHELAAVAPAQPVVRDSGPELYPVRARTGWAALELPSGRPGHCDASPATATVGRPVFRDDFASFVQHAVPARSVAQVQTI
jgi:hypothetical protein